MYIELSNGEGIVPIEIYDNEPYVDVYISGELADDVDSLEYLKDNYGKNLFATMEDYRAGNVIPVEALWPR